MKTTTYNSDKEIRIAIWFAVFAIAIFTTVKVKELQVNKMYPDEGIITENIHPGFPSLPVIDAKLIEEPVLEDKSVMNSKNDRSAKELAIQMQSWMDDNAYWSDDVITDEQELAVRIKLWINNGTYWNIED